MERAQEMRTRRLPPSQVNCKWWLKGHCFRGAACYFRHDEELHGRDKVSRPDFAQDTRANDADAHVATTTEAGPSSSSAPVAEPEKCGICLEVPLTYGLLVNCDHVFCLECLREWRASKNNGTRSPYSGDGPELRNQTKTCPMCRVRSEFIVPSSVFPTPPDSTELAPEAADDTEAGQEQDASQPSKPKNPAKEEIINAYLDRLKNIPCKYFEEGVKRWRDAQRRSLLDTPEFRPVCYFGNTCHYAHKHPVSNEPYVFSPEELEAIERKRAHAHAHHRGSHSGDPFASLDPRTLFDPSMFGSMIGAFGDFVERGSSSLGPPSTLPIILRALQEESLRHMGDADIFLEMDDEDGFGGGGFDDDWEDYYTGDEEHDRDDDDDHDDDEDDMPALIPLESSGSPANGGTNDDEDDMPALVPLESSGSPRNGGSNDDMPDLICLSGDDSDHGFGDLPDLVPLEHESSVTTPEDRAPGNSGDIADLISFIVGTDRNNIDEVPDLIEFD